MSFSTSVTVDWLSYTVFWGSPTLPWRKSDLPAAALANRAIGGSELWLETKARNGYTSALSAVRMPGLTVSWNVLRPDMGVHVNYSGSALREVHIPDVLDFIHANGHRVGRIDIAVDVRAKLAISDLYEQVKRGDAVTDVRKAPSLIISTGETLYVGSRTSEKYLRVYDKAAQTETAGDWTRIELECKGETARGVAGHLQQEGWARIPDIIRAFCDFPQDPGWTMAMSTPSPTLSIPKAERQSDTKSWLMTSVLPSLARELSGDREFAERFWKALAVMTDATLDTVFADLFDGKAD